MASHLPQRKCQGSVMSCAPSSYFWSVLPTLFPLLILFTQFFLLFLEVTRLIPTFASHSPCWNSVYQISTCLSACRCLCSSPLPPFSMRSILTTLFNSADCTKPSGNTTAFILFYVLPYCVYDCHLSFLEYRHLETRGLSISCIDVSQEIRTASGRLAHSKQWYIFSHKFCVYKWMTKLLQISYTTFVFHKHTWACISMSTHSHFFKEKRRNLNHFVCLFIKKEKRGWILGPWNKTPTALVCSGLLVCDCNFVVLIALDELKSKFSLDCF